MLAPSCVNLRLGLATAGSSLHIAPRERARQGVVECGHPVHLLSPLKPSHPHCLLIGFFVSLVADTVVADGQRYREMHSWLGGLGGTASRLLRESLLLVAVYFLLDVTGRPERALRVGYRLFL